MAKDDALIAQIGRTIGLWGDLKFYIHTDFPEQFKISKTYPSNRGDLTIAYINLERGIIRFVGYESIDSAKKLTNTKIFASEEQTKENCKLKEGQYFWFDIVGCKVQDGEEVMGKVLEVQRLGEIDYLYIQTNDTLVSKENLAKTFLIPYIERYVLRTDIEQKCVFVKDSRDILEAS